MSKIHPFLWFDNQAEEAVNFYVSVFKDATIEAIVRYGDAGPGPKGQVMTVAFRLFGQDYVALNGGPHFKFTEAISLVINCETQEEIDYYWDTLSEGGTPSRCGWLKDKFGLSWQVVPTILPKLAQDPVKADRVMQALMKMDKLDLKTLEEA